MTLVRRAMETPIGSARLGELAKGKKKIVIIASDHTRPVPSKVIIPHMLAEIRNASPDAKITILIATGCHRGTTKQELIDKFGEEIVELHALLEEGDSLARLTAIGRFYAMYTEMLPLLGTAQLLARSPSVIKALSYIEKHCTENYTTAELAKECFISESRLYHLFREELATTPVAYKNQMKILRSLEHIKTGYQTVEEISEMLGFHSAAYFRRVFKEFTGLSPMEYRKKYSLL